MGSDPAEKKTRQQGHKGMDKDKHVSQGKTQQQNTNSTSRVNSPVPFPTACKVVSGPRLSKSSFISSAHKQRRREKGGVSGEGRGGVPKHQTLTMRRLRRRYGESNKGTAVHRRHAAVLFGMLNECYHLRQTVTYLPLTWQQATGEAGKSFNRQTEWLNTTWSTSTWAITELQPTRSLSLLLPGCDAAAILRMQDHACFIICHLVDAFIRRVAFLISFLFFFFHSPQSLAES